MIKIDSAGNPVFTGIHASINVGKLNYYSNPFNPTYYESYNFTNLDKIFDNTNLISLAK